LLLLPRRTKNVRTTNDADTADKQRQSSIVSCMAPVKAPRRQASSQRWSVRSRKVSRHAIANVVAHVIGNHRSVAGTVFEDTGFDLADNVGIFIHLGEDTATETRQIEINDARTEAKGTSASNDVTEASGFIGIAISRRKRWYLNTEQSRADDQHRSQLT
jgi:hypothetical protein